MADQHYPPDRPEVPNTSRGEPSSHVEPRRFFANHSPVVWWIFGGLIVFVAIGVAAALFTYASEEGEKQARADITPAGDARPGAAGSAGAAGGSAVAGQPAPGVLAVRITAGGFVPDSATVPRGGSAVFSAATDCRLEQDGEVRATLASGQEYRFQASRPGQYQFACAGRPQRALITVP